MERMSLDVNKMTKDQLRHHILMLAMELTQLEKENKKLKRELDVVKGIKNSTVNVLINNDTKIKELEEENNKLKLHIGAKDKAYTALLKDYEELKKKNKEYKAEIEQRLNIIKDLHVRY